MEKMQITLYMMTSNKNTYGVDELKLSLPVIFALPLHNGHIIVYYFKIQTLLSNMF